MKKEYRNSRSTDKLKKIVDFGRILPLPILSFFIILNWQLPNSLYAQQTISASNVTENKNSKLTLKEIWAKNFEGQTTITGAHILLGPDQKLQSIEVNANQLEKTNNIWRPTTFSFDLNGVREEKNHLDDEYAYVSSNGKRISFGNSGWKLEGSNGNLIHQSSKGILKENLLFSPDDSLMMGFDEEGQNVAVYDAEGKQILKLEGEIHATCFSPDNQYIGLIYRNPKKPKLADKFCLFDQKGNTVFEFALDTQGKSCSFNEDGSKIAVVTWGSLYFIDLKGNVVWKIAQPRGGLGLPIFIKPNLFVTTGGSNVWKVNLSSDIPKVESIQKIDYPRSIAKIGDNFVVIYGIGNTGPNPGTDRGIEIINSTGQLLASAKLLSTLDGIQVKEDYIVVWSCCSLSLFRVSKE
jgi:hypothetical protein